MTHPNYTKTFKETDMPIISINDVKNAVTQADTRRTNRNDGGFSVNVGGAIVNVIYGTQQQGNRTLVNYGLPTMYVMARADIDALRQWWKRAIRTPERCYLRKTSPPPSGK